MSQSSLKHHSLQRVVSPSRGASLVFHAISLVSFAHSFYYLTITENPINTSYGWHFQFLTIIGLLLSTITFTVALLADIFLSSTLFSLKNALAVTSAPMEVLISILYWGLRAIDPKLVVPDWAPPIVFWVDIGFHLTPTIVLISDILFLSPPSALTALPALGISSAIAILYWYWVELCYQQNGFYPYPIFAEAGHQGRIGLFSMSAITMALGVWALQRMYILINGRLPATSTAEQTRKSQ